MDLLVIVVAIIVVLGGWSFVELAGEMSEGDTRTFDEWMLRALRNPADLSDPRGPHWLEVVVRDVSGLGGHTVLTLVTVIAVGFLLLCRKFHASILVLIAVVGGILFSSLLKAFYGRPRPDLVPHLTEVYDASFPSGHAMLSAVVYLTLGSLLARLVGPMRLKVYILCIALMLTFLVGISRIYLGIHYPTDVLAGWTLGLVWALLCWLLGRHLQDRGTLEKAMTEEIPTRV